jgi:gliding motility-associated-like protein
MKQFYALFLLLFACVPVLGNGLTLSNSEDFNCPSRTAEIFAIQQPSKCVHPYGGEMSARLRDANGTIITQDLQYAWYDANYPGNEAYKIGVGAKVTKVPPGTYLVIITDTRLGCTYFSAPVTLEKPVTPWFEVEYLENVIGCDAAPYGRIKLNSENRWKARWFHGEEIGTGNGIPKYLSLDRFEELPPGTYTVVYEDVNSGCFSDPFTFTIGGYPITPTVNASIVADTTCTTGSGSISLTASTPAPGTEPERGYTYEWRDANGNLLPQYTNLATATGLPAGTYTIKVTGDYNDDAYECSSIVSFTVPHQPSRPVISLQNTPNTICSGSAYNGTITVNVTYKGQVVTNFSNYTFRWTDANGNTGTVSGTNLIPNLNGGTYTVVATEVSLGCDSDQATTTLNNQLPDQNFALLVTPQTTCAGTPNGALEISNYSISPASSTQPTYTWYIGTNTDPATGTRLPTANLSSSTRAISLTGGQTYTVVATDPASGCTVSRSMTVPLQEGVVTVVATPTPNSICSPATAKNGRIQVTEVRFNNVVVTDLTGYTFSWFVEGSTTPISGQTGTSLTGREAGRYQVRATRTDLGCISDPLTVEIVDQLPVQTLTLNATPQTSCDANNPNGRIDAIYSISPASTGTVTYRWFPGSTATGTPLSFTGASATGLTGGQTYTVEATDGASGCSIVRSVTVPLQQPAIALTAQVTDNTICAADRKNGAIQASVTYNGSPVTDLTGYTFSWYVEGSTTAIQNETGPSLTGRAAGRYQVRVLHNELQCPSDPITAEIKDVLPALALTLDPTDQTSCNGTPNGAIDASLSIDGTTAGNGYTLEWFLGTGTTTALSANNFSGNTAFNIAGATYYTVRATHTESGCQTISSVFVPARDGIVTFDYVAYANSICDPELAVPGVYNGRIEIPTVYFNGDDDNANLSNYSFSWWQEASGSFIRLDGQTGSTLANIEPGRYQVEIRRTDLDCTTGRITIEVPNETVDPQLTLQIGQQQLYCVAPYSGIINASITVGGNPVNLSDYRFEWFRGTTIYGTKLSFTGNQATELDKGYYTVRAINTLTGCEDIEVIYMPEQLTTPLTSLAVQQIEGCLAEERGSFTATVMEGATEADYSNYTFHWYRGQTASGTPLATKSRLLDGLDGGDPLPSDYYTVVAVNEVTRCEALPQTGFLKAPVAVSNDYIINRRPSACNIDYGIATVWVVDEHGNANTTDYTFEWYEGRPTDPKANFYTDPKVEFTGDRLALLPRADYDMTTNIVGTVYPASTASYEGPTAYGLESGVYTVVITDSEGCKSMMEVVIAFENAPESLVMRLEHVEDCEGSFGGVGVKAVDVNDVPFPDQSRYAFFLYRGSNVMQSALINQNPVFGPVGTSDETYFGPSTGFDLEPGFYTIIAVDYFGSECSSTSRSFEIYQIAQPPVVSAGAIVASSMCEGGNGAATLTISNAEYTPGQLDYAISEVSIRWTSWPGSDAGDNTNRPADVTGALLQANDPSNPDYKQVIRTFSGLAAGTYELMVTGDTGCETPLTLVIPGAPVQPTVVATPINQTYCDPANGSIDITSVNGGSPNVADYTFYLYNGQENLANGNHMATGSLADMEALQLPNATYYLVAVQNLSTGPGSGCSSAPVELRIRNVSVYPQVVLAVNPNESCDPNEQTGEVSATISSATGTFSYSWYQVEANDNLLPRGNGTVTAGPIPTTLYLSELGPGLYRIEIVAENGCPVWAEMQLGNYIQVPVITQVTASNQTTCDDDQANGTLTVEEITYANSIYNATTGFGDFSFVWYLNGVELTDFTGPALTNRIAGDYSVEVFKIENPSKFCRSAPYTIEVEKVPLYPSVLAVRTQVNNACDVPYTGAIEVDMAFQTSYSYVLLHEDGTPTGFAGTDVTAALLQFTALDGGEYRLEISQANGCPLVQEITVPEAEILPVVLTVEATNQTSCSDAAADADGTLEITAIGYSDGAAAVLADFSFSWTGVDINGNTFTGSGTSLSGLVAGTYTVVATKNNTPPGAGCQSAPFTIEVQKVPLYPALADIETEPNTACDASYTGVIRVNTVTFQTSYSYRLLFENGSSTGLEATDVSLASLQFTGMAPGTYQLEIQQLNGCPISQLITVGEALLQPVIMAATSSSQTTCVGGDGGAEVISITYNGVETDISEFTWVWYASDMSTVVGTDYRILTGLEAGTYYVVATKKDNPGSGCASAPYEVQISHKPEYPTIALDGVDNTSCLATAGNGTLTATITDFGTSYSYTLYLNNAPTAYSGTGQTAGTLSFSNLLEGEYRLVIVPQNGCQLEAIRTLERQDISGEISLAAQDQSTCNADGSIDVNQILFAGQTYSGADILANFELVLIDAAGNRLTDVALPTTTGARFVALVSGTYTVEATRRQPVSGTAIGQGCSVTSMIGVGDVSVEPELSLTAFRMISECFGSPFGMLSVSVDGYTHQNVPAHYTISWFYRQTITAVEDPNNPGTYIYTPEPALLAGRTSLMEDNLVAGFYTIRITDAITGCSTEMEYAVEQVEVEIAIRATANDQTKCEPENGEIFVEVINEREIIERLGYLPTFDFEVYRGEQTDLSGELVDGTNAAALYSRGSYVAYTYTIYTWFNGQAHDLQNCHAIDQVVVNYIDHTPDLRAEQEAILTICDPDRPNASATAYIGDGRLTEGYIFNWYLGEIHDDNLYSTGPVATELSLGTYWVEVIDTFTGCTNQMSVEITAEYPDVPFVDAMLRATIATSCAAPNGSLEVIVANRDGFDFAWYRGEVVDEANRMPNGTFSYLQEGLAEGWYTVVATDLANGCVSNSVSKYLGGEYIFPEYEILLTPASCATPGTARIVDLTGTLREFYIYDAQGNLVGDHTAPFSGIAGNYLLKVISLDGCEKSEPFTITDTVAPFNAITPNGDGQNDYFHFSCIDLYPENLLRIYNRAGGLVFELNGYDNQLNVFTGKGNRGLYLGDKDLPAGTYFWVLFRNNTNEKPKTGFLELIR